MNPSRGFCYTPMSEFSFPVRDGVADQHVKLLPLYGLHRNDPLCHLVRRIRQHEGMYFSLEVIASLMPSLQECLTRHKQMVAAYLDANYDKVLRISLSRKAHTDTCVVLHSLPTSHSVSKLRHQTSISQTSRRDPPR